MKKLFLMMILPLLLCAGIDFSKHIDDEVADISLEVTNLAHDDVLNLRAEPSAKGKIVYRIPNGAKNLITHDREIVKKIGKNQWIAVRLGFGEGFYNGWVNAKYVKLYNKYNPLCTEDLVVVYPDFLEAIKTKDGWIEIFDSIDFEHYSGCDERDNPKLLDELSRFNIKLKVYYSLLDVFADDKLYDMDTYEELTTRDWFKKDTKGFVEEVDFYGLKGYKNSIGAEGCGINRYYFKIDGKILVIREPFDFNPPLLKGKERSLPNNIKFHDKDEIMQYIIRNLRLF
jgi:hypothetical protein